MTSTSDLGRLRAVQRGMAALAGLLVSQSALAGPILLHPGVLHSSRLYPDSLYTKMETGPRQSADQAMPRFADSGPPPMPPGRSREISDQEHAKVRRDSGENRSFEELFGRAQSVGRGEYLGVEPDISRNVYRFKFMRPGGNVIWVDMDGATGRVISSRQ